MKNLLIPVFAVTILFSCSEETEKIKAQSGESISTVSADSELSPSEIKKMDADYKKEVAEREKIESSQTTLKFDKLVHDFGEVKAETDNFVQVVVTNTGDRPLIISDVSASCGCTMPKKPEGPIAPGASDIIEVKFHSKPGQLGEVSKTVTVTANTAEVIHKFEIKAFVK